MVMTRLRNHMTHGFLYSKLTIESYQDFDSQNDFVKIRKLSASCYFFCFMVDSPLVILVIQLDKLFSIVRFIRFNFIFLYQGTAFCFV